MKSTIVRLATRLALISVFSVSAAIAADSSDAALKAQAKISQAEATTTALAQCPNGKIESAEIENEGGKLVWSFDISMPKTANITEIQVDAMTGKIVSNTVETPRDQAKEATADRK